MLRLALALPLAAVAASCGQKGPLYHPPPVEETEDDETSAAPAVPDSHPA